MANISVRMDDNLKAQTEAILDALGISMTTAVTMFAKAIVREHRMPLNLSVDPFYLESNQEHLRKVISEYENGKVSGIQKTIEELEAMENA